MGLGTHDCYGPVAHQLHRCDSDTYDYDAFGTVISSTGSRPTITCLPAKAEMRALLGNFQSVTGAYFSRRQRYGRSTTDPGRGALAAIESMSCSTVLCCATLPGSPRAWPKGQCRYKKRGAWAASATSFTRAKATVVTPLASISLASSPTDRVQIGQAGTRRTRSTPDSLMRRATSFIAGMRALALPIKPNP
jgi:hypothetical protein